MTLVAIRSLNKSYTTGGEVTHVLKGADLEMKKGELSTPVFSRLQIRCFLPAISAAPAGQPEKLRNYSIEGIFTRAKYPNTIAETARPRAKSRLGLRIFAASRLKRRGITE